MITIPDFIPHAYQLSLLIFLGFWVFYLFLFMEPFFLLVEAGAEASFQDHLQWLRARQQSVGFVLTIVARLLPPSERSRYLEEFLTELLDLPHNTRLRHALSLLRGTFVQRLRRGHKDKAANAAVRTLKS